MQPIFPTHVGPTALVLMLLPLVGGSLISSKISTATYDARTVGPPRWVFPVAWTILYLLLGYSAYRVGVHHLAILLWVLGLVLNWSWTPIYFGKGDKQTALHVLQALIVVTVIMAIAFYRIDQPAGVLQLPYIAWLVYAHGLNQASIDMSMG